MARVFVPGTARAGQLAALDAAEAHYVRDVLRLRAGAEVCVVDAGGTEFAGRLAAATAAEVAVELVAVRERAVEPGVELHLLPGWPKGRKLDAIVQQTTQLGVARITPVLCRRSVPRLQPAAAAERQARLRRVAVAATRQSGRQVVPRLDAPAPFPEALRLAREADRCLLFAETAAGAVDLRRALGDAAPVASLSVLVGPEGGWAEEELAAAREAGVTLVHLGPRILRAETAAVVACALCLYELGQLNP